MQNGTNDSITVTGYLANADTSTSSVLDRTPANLYTKCTVVNRIPPKRDAANSRIELMQHKSTLRFLRIKKQQMMTLR